MMWNRGKQKGLQQLGLHVEVAIEICKGLNAIKLFLLLLPPFFFFSLCFLSLSVRYIDVNETIKNSNTFIRWHNISSESKVKELVDYSQQNIRNERTCRS